MRMQHRSETTSTTKPLPFDNQQQHASRNITRHYCWKMTQFDSVAKGNSTSILLAIHESTWGYRDIIIVTTWSNTLLPLHTGLGLCLLDVVQPVYRSRSLQQYQGPCLHSELDRLAFNIQRPQNQTLAYIEASLLTQPHPTDRQHF